MSALPSKRQELINQLRLLLGDLMVDVELEPEHYDLAISMAIDKLRQRSDGALEEEDIFLTLQPDVEEYTLPDEVQEVRRLYRRNVGVYTSGGTDFSPMEAGFVNAFMMTGKNSNFSLATWDFFYEYLETAERVLAGQLSFIWYNSTKKLKLLRRPRAEEDVIVRVWTTKSEDAVLSDPYAYPWIRSYSLAMAKGMLGRAYSKFPGGFPGPNGSVLLNGDQLLQEANAEIEKLEEELLTFTTSSDGYGFVIG